MSRHHSDASSLCAASEILWRSQGVLRRWWLRNNCPLNLLIQEYRFLWFIESVSALVSLGTGGAVAKSVKISLGLLVKKVANILTDTEQQAAGFERIADLGREGQSQTYFRFSIEAALYEVRRGEWKKLGVVAQGTRSWMAVKWYQLAQCAEKLSRLGEQRGIFSDWKQDLHYARL